MLKVIRSQLYQLVLDKVIFMILLFWLVADGIGIYSTLYEIFLSREPVSGGTVFVGWFDPGTIFIMLLTLLVMTKDFFDKTLYYELLSGKSRMQVFMGRFLTVLMISEGLFIIRTWLFPLLYTAGFGWGRELAFGGALLRMLFGMMYIFRLCAEFAFFAMLFRKKGFAFFMIPAVFVVSDLLVSEIGYALRENSALKKYLPCLNLFLSNAEESVCMFGKVYVVDGDYSKYIAMPENIGVVLFSLLAVGALLLAAGCLRFARKDME